jgi:hypothetical protein
MLKKLALTSALALVMAAPVMAQTTTAPSTATPSTATPPARTMTNTTTTSSNQIDAHKMIGRSIQNAADNKTVGKIDSVILDQSGKVDQVVVGVGGFLGVGKKDVAVNWSELQVSNNGEKIVMNTTKDSLKAMPEFTWPKDKARGTVWTASDRDRRAAPTSSGAAGTAVPPGGTAR